MITLSKCFTFEASHVLPKHPGKCSRLHGHSWKLTVSVAGEVDKVTGFVVDYGVFSECVKSHLIDLIDHQHLGQFDISNEVDGYPAVFGHGFYPTSENLVIAFAKMLKPFTNELKVELVEISLDETCTCRATWRPQ